MLDVADFQLAARRAADAMRAAEDELNAADSKLGDGDTGQTMRRVAEVVATAAGAHRSTDLGELVRQLGMAGMTATGSSLGTLLSVGLLEMGKSLKGRETVSPADLAAALAAAEAAMLARGKASLGDKTALDVLHAVRTQLEIEPDNVAAVADAAGAAVEAFRDRPCRIGRARMYAEKSIGIDDPGMLALARLAAAITVP